MVCLLEQGFEEQREIDHSTAHNSSTDVLPLHFLYGLPLSTTTISSNINHIVKKEGKEP